MRLHKDYSLCSRSCRLYARGMFGSIGRVSEMTCCKLSALNLSKFLVVPPEKITMCTRTVTTNCLGGLVEIA